MLPECDKAIILLHEIYGINAHIQRTAATWRSRGFDVYTPALFPHSAPFAYEQQEQAWRHTLTITSDSTPPPLSRCWPS